MDIPFSLESAAIKCSINYLPCPTARHWQCVWKAFHCVRALMMCMLQCFDCNVLSFLVHLWVRFEKRIYIPLPDKNARTEIFKIHIGNTPNNLSEADYKTLGSEAEGLVTCVCT